MLTYDPSARISAKQALNHSWIKLEHQLTNNKLYIGNELQSIKTFCQMNQFQNAIMVYISHNLMQNQLMRELQAKFKSIDRNGDGLISW